MFDYLVSLVGMARLTAYHPVEAPPVKWSTNWDKNISF